MIAFHRRDLAIFLALRDGEDWWESWVGDRIEWYAVELEGLAVALDLHFQVAGDIGSPLVDSITVTAESVWAGRTV